MKKILLSILCISLYACQESKSAEPEITQEEVDKQEAQKRLADLGDEVDEYPSFKECESITTKDEKLKCFTDRLSKAYQEALNSQKLAIGGALSDTIKVTLVVSNEGVLSVKSVEASDNTLELLPDLEKILKDKTAGFEFVLTPAKKNQVSVTTEYVLPLVIDVK
ncbi:MULTISPECIES: hypothetical protein [Capnocytophaga]|jgi:hypothetical protein|uniref:TonB protein C-terminal n=1 Tax=Capnocytophaga granulosa TaxID=45242 RepID=A0A1H2QAB2_9FLAO|nr:MULTISPECIES: hypothetical protein [Capnocytophaga]RKW19111.1 MAG: hypothetical protein D8H93_00845 [Capnocytophaga sp.]EJU31537.1 putative lipoprotein [Capnocytophaga sp. CM59]EPD29671.1 hypothetical protein HMPREF9331_00299 [Capnocytophaga granulosa ATCC 51502]SDW03748.1 hypothetical protein SAMN05444420_10186 [Capnocytophaga granulosa]SUX22471.1 Uncharacterised protein [Capnocytophaga granulosa]